MPTAAEKSLGTREKYGKLGKDFVAQYINEAHAPGWPEYSEQCVAAAYWFLDNGGGRWSASYIRLLAAALSALIGDHRDWGLTEARTADALLLRLRHDRPASRRRQGRTRKSAPNADIRQLVDHLRSQGDQFGRWIAGYIQIAIRIGWRPVEILSAYLDGTLLRAPAAKTSNGRGLCETCEVDLAG